eukprot:gene36121-43804_t
MHLLSGLLYLFTLAASAIALTGNKGPRKPWELARFIKTAGFYNSLLPKLPFLKSVNSDRIVLTPNTLVWDANQPEKSRVSLKWGPLDDVVMGGASKTDLEPGQSFTGKWTGIVTTANNGGFAGIRTKFLSKPLDASSCTGLLLKVEGDGQRYKFIARDDDNWNGVAWSKSFDTVQGKTIEVKIPLDSLRPTKFARTVSSLDKVNKAQITALQFSLSKFEYDGALNPTFKEGSFQLIIKSIGTY